MCLGIPGRITHVDGMEARAEFWEVEKTVRLDIVGDDVEEGDYILNHAGFAIRKIPDEEVEETIAIYEAFLAGDEDDALDELGAEDERLGIERGGGARGPAATPTGGPPGTRGSDPADGSDARPPESMPAADEEAPDGE